MTWKKLAAAMSSRMSLAWTGSSSAEPLYRYCITCSGKKVNVTLMMEVMMTMSRMAVISVIWIITMMK